MTKITLLSFLHIYVIAYHSSVIGYKIEEVAAFIPLEGVGEEFKYRCVLWCEKGLGDKEVGHL